MKRPAFWLFRYGEKVFVFSRDARYRFEFDETTKKSDIGWFFMNAATKFHS